MFFSTRFNLNLNTFNPNFLFDYWDRVKNPREGTVSMDYMDSCYIFYMKIIDTIMEYTIIIE